VTHAKKVFSMIRILLAIAVAATFGFDIAEGAPATTQAGVKAFPTAEGFGAVARGGREGRVLFVTNLNDEGPGSLREAVETRGPRTIVFRVGGTIRLKKRIEVREPFVTIAGQTAPGEGICLANYEFYIRTNDAVVRHLRVRPGDVSPGERDAITIRECDRVIVDHCSASWSIDELLSTTKAKNVTVQWCLITEALHNTHHHKGNHGFGSLIQCDGASYHHNLYAHNRSRNPRPASGLIDFRNNVIYDWDRMAGYAEDNQQRLNYIANWLAPGPSTNSGRETAFHTGKSKSTIYFRDNVLDGVVGDGEDDRKIINVRNGGQVAQDEFSVAPVKTDTATAACQRVLEGAGATRPVRDVIDARVVDSVRQRSGRQIDSQNDVSGWVELKSGAAPADADDDGMPDVWEKQKGLNPADASDASADRNGDGYTNLEEYLNELAP